jgi:hypothetical protein
MRQFLDGALDAVSAYTPALDMDTQSVAKPRGWDADATARETAQWGQLMDGTVRRMTHSNIDVIAVTPVTVPSLKSETLPSGSQIPVGNVVTQNPASIQPFADYWPVLPTDNLAPHTTHLHMPKAVSGTSEGEGANHDDHLVASVAAFLVGMPPHWWEEVRRCNNTARKVLLGKLFTAYHSWREMHLPPFLHAHPKKELIRTLMQVFDPAFAGSPATCLAGGPDDAESVLLGSTLCDGDAAYYEDEQHAHAFWSTHIPQAVAATPTTLVPPLTVDASTAEDTAENDRTHVVVPAQSTGTVDGTLGAAELAASALAAGDTVPAELATHALAAQGPDMSNYEAGAGVGVEDPAGMAVDVTTVQAHTQSADGAVDDRRDAQDMAAAAAIAAWTAARQEERDEREEEQQELLALEREAQEREAQERTAQERAAYDLATGAAAAQVAADAAVELLRDSAAEYTASFLEHQTIHTGLRDARAKHDEAAAAEAQTRARSMACIIYEQALERLGGSLHKAADAAARAVERAQAQLSWLVEETRGAKEGAR